VPLNVSNTVSQTVFPKIFRKFLWKTEAQRNMWLEDMRKAESQRKKFKNEVEKIFS